VNFKSVRATQNRFLVLFQQPPFMTKL